MTLGKAPLHPPPLAPSPTLPPSPALGRGAGLVVAGDAGTEAQHTQDTGPKPQEHNQPRGISWAHLAPIPTVPRRPKRLSPSLPGDARVLRRFSLPSRHWIGKRYTGLNVDGSAASQHTDGKLHPLLAQWSQLCHIASSQHWNCSTLEPFPRAKRRSLAWKGRLCLDVLEVVHWSCCSF